ncbi:MAG TPA: hypothetical protein VGL59_10120 [Polyangia bacterium]
MFGAALVVGCGDQATVVGPVDLSQAPAALTMTCDHGVGQVAFANPCLVGGNLASAKLDSVGNHETECSLAGEGGEVAWAFILPLSAIAQRPDQPLTFQKGQVSTPPSGQPIEVAGQTASVTDVAGTMTFLRLDPSARAFIGHFQGQIDWLGANGAFSCTVDADLWGAPGGFI